MKNLIFIAFALFGLVSCSDHDEPTPSENLQVAEITNGNTDTQTITYDAKGRVSKYVASYANETVTSTYTYPSDNVIEIHTEVVSYLGSVFNNLVRNYDDEMRLENGFAAYCDGIFTTYQEGSNSITQKKYRQEFSYTSDNRLSAVKNTEWYKRYDNWVLDQPWTWENRYLWDRGNLVEVEDYCGHDWPEYIFKYEYSAVGGVQNVIPFHFDRYQYYPLMLEGVFGKQSNNLITRVVTEHAGSVTVEKVYDYGITADKITAYTETQNGAPDSFTVSWTGKR